RLRRAGELQGRQHARQPLSLERGRGDLLQQLFDAPAHFQGRVALQRLPQRGGGPFTEFFELLRGFYTRRELLVIQRPNQRSDALRIGRGRWVQACLQEGHALPRRGRQVPDRSARREGTRRRQVRPERFELFGVCHRGGRRRQQQIRAVVALQYQQCQGGTH